MIKLTDLLALNKMTYNSGPKGRHKKRMMTPLTLFENEYALPNQLPPENSSATTLDEIKHLASIKQNKKFVKVHDNIKEVFKDTLAELELPYIEEELDSLLKQSEFTLSCKKNLAGAFGNCICIFATTLKESSFLLNITLFW